MGHFPRDRRYTLFFFAGLLCGAAIRLALNPVGWKNTLDTRMEAERGDLP
jgi:hypothetical protein